MQVFFSRNNNHKIMIFSIFFFVEEKFVGGEATSPSDRNEKLGRTNAMTEATATLINHYYIPISV